MDFSLFGVLGEGVPTFLCMLVTKFIGICCRPVVVKSDLLLFNSVSLTVEGG